MANVIMTIEEFKKFIAEHDEKSIDNVLSPPLLTSHVAQWRTYPKVSEVTTCSSDIDATMDTLDSHLVALDAPIECRSSFMPEGALRLNIKSHAAENLLPAFMQGLLCYISLISVLPKEEQRINLMQFPPREAMEFQCLLGTMERMQAVLLKLQLQSLPLDKRLLMEAHLSVVEAGRSLCSPLIVDGNQPHLASGIAHLAGFEDTRSIGRAIAYDIPASRAWIIYRDYVGQVNAELKKRKNEYVTRIAELIGVVEAYRAIEADKEAEADRAVETYKAVKADREKAETALVLLFEELNLDLSVITDTSDPERAVYDVSKVPELFPEVELTAEPKLSFDLLDEDAPAQIAALLYSGVPARQQAALKALRLLGHPQQQGYSFIQFLRCFHEIGALSGKTGAEAFAEGLSFFLSLKDVPLLTGGINLLEPLINQYIHVASDVSSYITYLSDESVLPSLLILVQGRAPLSLINKKLETISPEELLEFFKQASIIVNFISDRSDAPAVLCQLMSRVRERLSVEQYSTHLRRMCYLLVFRASKRHYLNIIDCIENNFNLTKPSDIESYKNGLRMLFRSLFNARNKYGTNLGITYLAIHDAKFMVEKFHSLTAIFEKDPIELLMQRPLGANSIIYSLAEGGHLYSLKPVLALVSPREQKELVCQVQWNGLMAIEAAIFGGHLGVLNHFLSLRFEDGNPVINLKDDPELALKLLVLASDCDQDGAIISLIAAGADIALKHDGMSLLHLAAKTDSAKVIKCLAGLERDGKRLIDIDEGGVDNCTPLRLAVAYENKSAIDALTAAGADLKLILHIAIDEERADLIPYLLSLKQPDGSTIDINYSDESGFSALMHAIKLGNKEAFDILVAAGADITPSEGTDLSLLHIAVDNWEAELLSSILSWRLSDGTPAIDINWRNTSGDSAFMRAVNDDNEEAITALLAAGADASLCNNLGDSPLHSAVVRGRDHLIPVLMGLKKADGLPVININQRNNRGYTPLALAYAKGNKAAIAALLVAGADATHCAPDGSSLLHSAVQNASLDFIQFLLNFRRPDGTSVIDVNGLNRAGFSPLFMLIGYRSITFEKLMDTMKLLLAAGADLSPAGHYLLIDHPDRRVMHALLGFISSEQLLKMLLFKNTHGFSAIQRLVAIIDEDSKVGQQLLKDLLAKLNFDERISLLFDKSSTGKITLSFARPSVRAILCEGLPMSEVEAQEVSLLKEARGAYSKAVPYPELRSLGFFGDYAPHVEMSVSTSRAATVLGSETRATGSKRSRSGDITGGGAAAAAAACDYVATVTDTATTDITATGLAGTKRLRDESEYTAVTSLLTASMSNTGIAPPPGAKRMRDDGISEELEDGTHPMPLP